MTDEQKDIVLAERREERDRPDINNETFDPWTLGEAIDIVRKFEEIAQPYKYHTGLLGSVLYKGSSNNDVDIMFIPRRTHRRHDLLGLYQALKDFGLERWELRDHKSIGDFKLVYACTWKGKRLDLFFLKE
jgi:hypothetical protein